MVMTTTHTPGPWHYQGVGSGYEITARTSLGAKFAGYHIATVIKDSPGFEPVSRETTEANARLIAAAPELLAALEHAEHYLRLRLTGLEYGGYEWNAAQSAHNAARAAIAKARGES